MEEDIKILLFARWLMICYSYQEISGENSYWYKQQVEHFNLVVYPEYVKNGTVEEHRKLFEGCGKLRDAFNDLP